MIGQFKEAKTNRQILHFKNFQKPTVDWQDVLNFVFSESQVDNPQLAKREKPEHGINIIGNIQIQNKLWLAPQTNKLFSIIDGVQDLLLKVNDGRENKECGYYNKTRSCTCDAVWHTQGVRISLGSRPVSDHRDPHDILYWQLLGTSYWKINRGEVFKLEPGDLFYFSQEDSHEVWCDEPRAGIIIDGIGLSTK